MLQLHESGSRPRAKGFNSKEINRIIDGKVKLLMGKVELAASFRGVNLEMIGVNVWAKNDSMQAIVIEDQDVRNFHMAPSSCEDEDQFLSAKVQITL